MKISKSIQIGLLFLPLFIGLTMAIALQGISGSNPIIRFQARADLGTLALIGGSILSIILLGGWTVRNIYNRSLKRSLSIVLSETSQTRRRFLGRLDHELRNPLTALQITLEYLYGTPNEIEVTRGLNDISVQAGRLRSLVTDLRKLADLEEQTIERQPVDIGELLKEVLEIIQVHPDYDERQVQLTLLQSPWKLSYVQGDRALLSLACYNLLDNALKFTQAGDNIEVRAFEVDNWLVIEVADNGPGIPDNDLPFIFEELYRGSNTSDQPGSGLGLTLVQTIVRRHGGSVTVRSRSGQGTVFTLRLPL
ncbi:MAG: HAMP domain-containing histidine kinase [Anaerolineales bacterium]|nr:HAMP domain-containing histidine kinase [Anaerolineales bacterium]